MKAEVQTVTLKNNLKTVMRFWIPDISPKAVIVGVHGFAEHSGRYSHFGEFLAENGYSLYMYDLRGHGLAEYERGYINSFEDFINDTLSFFDTVKSQSGSENIFLFGHSMGGLIATHVAARLDGQIKGLITSGAAVEVRTSITQNILLNLLGTLTPHKRLPLPVSTQCLTHNEEIVKKYVEDPLVFKDPTVKLLKEFGRGVSSVWRYVPLISVPVFILHGEEDCLVPPTASERLYEKVSSSDKTLRIYKGMKHEILNETDWKVVAQEIVEWIAKHI